MLITIQEEKWTARLLFSPQSEMKTLMHCTAEIDAKTKDDALSGAQTVLDLLAKGRKTFLRVAPEAHSEQDFDTKQLKIGGFVRFSFALEPGEWTAPEPQASTVSFAALEAQA